MANDKGMMGMEGAAAEALTARLDFFVGLYGEVTAELVKAIKADNRLQTVLLSAKLTQLCSIMSEEHEVIATGLLDSRDEAKLCNASCQELVNLCNDHAKALLKDMGVSDKGIEDSKSGSSVEFVTETPGGRTLN